MSEDLKKEDTKDAPVGLSPETLQRMFDEACRDIQHGHSGGAEEAKWASDELEKLGLRAI